MDPNERLQELMEQRGWTEYRLAKNCGLNHSTISNIFRRNTVPSIATLEMICKGFGISLAQFFSTEDMVELTPELKELFDCWTAFTPKQREAIVHMLQAMQPEHKE